MLFDAIDEELAHCKSGDEMDDSPLHPRGSESKRLVGGSTPSTHKRGVFQSRTSCPDAVHMLMG